MTDGGMEATFLHVFTLFKTRLVMGKQFVIFKFIIPSVIYPVAIHNLGTQLKQVLKRKPSSLSQFPFLSNVI
jgi:hypothetical protein